jgi:hypothetical protein
MTRGLNAGIDAAVGASALLPALLAEIETEGEPIRAWSGFGPLVWDGKTFVGTGTFGRISTVEESTDGSAKGLVYELSGIPQDLVSASLTTLKHNLVARLWFAVLDINGRLAAEPHRLHIGETDVPELVDDGTSATIRLNVETRSVDQRRSRVRRYTPADQNIEHPDDKGFEYTAGLQDTRIKWGKA